MKTRIAGKVLLLGKNIDTDQIYPGRFLEIVDPAEIGRHCLCGVDERIAAAFPPGGLIVAGSNFGCGSSREHAAIALISMGAAAVIAESFARIFFRNGINLGLPLISCPGISGKVLNGDSLEADLLKNVVTVPRIGEEIPFPPLGDHVLAILRAGGVKALFRERSGRGQPN
ncbi:MAG: 3-isopropylmalate dehydratase small subunit [Treponema sp.]|jgi:3-isopropylmalate/(R)-2-methylmalate dehydratase small subunit|nr:3-isopropylmalate dehydratase small subunit [Treponema sp.]